MKYKITLSDNSTVEIDCDSEQTAKSEMEHRMQFASMMGGEKLDVVKLEAEK